MTFLNYVKRYPSTYLFLSDTEKKVYQRPEVEEIWQSLLSEMGLEKKLLSKQDFLLLSILFSMRLKEKADRVSRKD